MYQMNNISKVKVWDPLVRFFHWSLVIAFFTAYITEDDFLTLHTYAGYTILGLVLFRIVWGLIGTRHARFSSFVTSPGTAWQYVKDTLQLRAKRYVGHNPAGGAMIILLLVSLFITTLSGIATYGAVESAGPLGHWLGNIGESGEDLLEEVHEFFANFTVILVAIHVTGVIIESLLHRENLVKSMLHGFKTVNSNESAR
jgi:cytochrome b